MDKTQYDPQNPYALFSPDQWLNKFSNYNNAALPWPSSYVGMPTDAMGKPIQPPPGMTINSAPQAAAPQPAPAAPTNTGWNQNPVGSPLNPAGDWTQLAPNVFPDDPQRQANYAYNLGLGGFTDPNTKQAYIGGRQKQAAAPAPAAPTGPTYPQILSMLANPGKVTTPGATVPESASTQPGPGAVPAFLQSWQPAQSGPGSGFQQSFNDTLRALQAGATDPSGSGSVAAAPAPAASTPLAVAPQNPSPAAPQVAAAPAAAAAPQFPAMAAAAAAPSAMPSGGLPQFPSLAALMGLGGGGGGVPTAQQPIGGWGRQMPLFSPSGRQLADQFGGYSGNSGGW